MTDMKHCQWEKAVNHVSVYVHGERSGITFTGILTMISEWEDFR